MSPSSNDTRHAEIQGIQRQRGEDEHHYTMRISRRTVDKLGVKLYDKASAVVAELVANAYDADAERVRVRLPLATLLGSQPSPERITAKTEEADATWERGSRSGGGALSTPEPTHRAAGRRPLRHRSDRGAR